MATQTLDEPLLNTADEKVELEIRNDYGNANDFEVLTNDISFVTKVRLLLWKNMKIQCLRRPKSCCAKCCVPFFVMLICVLLTFAFDSTVNNDAYGFEFDYILSNTGDAADYTNYFPITPFTSPWPDTSIANQWIKYIICPPQTNNQQRRRGGGGASDDNDDDPPKYLAIVAKDYKTNQNLIKLLNILSNKYSNDNYKYKWFMNTVNDNTWFSYSYSLTSTTTTSPSTTNTPNNINTTINDNDISTTNYNNYSSTIIPNTTINNQFIYSDCWSQVNITSFVNFTEGSLLKFFNSEDELEDYISSASYGSGGYNFENTAQDATRPIGTAIIFNTIGDNNGLLWDYTLRMNSSVVPSTNTLVDIFTKNINDLYSSGLDYYIRQNGFIQLQNWLDESIMEYILNETYINYTNYTDIYAEYLSYTRDYSKGAFMFPTKSYKSDDYWSSVGAFFAFFLFIMFVYPVITVLSILVEEKQSKIKEGMKMMGATTSAYWLSWYLWFFFEFTLMALGVTILGVGGGVFRYSSSLVIFLWFWLFCLSSACFAILFSTFFDNPKTGSLFGLIAFFAVLIGGQFSASLDEYGKTGLCLLAPSCFVVSIDTLVQYETSVIGINFDNMDDEYNDFKFSTSLKMMAIDIVIYIILTLYLDQTFPSRYGQKQPIWFFLLPSYWCGKCCSNNESSQKADISKRRMSSIINSKTYEPVVNSQYNDAVISIRNLTKTFKSIGISTKTVHAVQSISMDIYRGEVFCLLGHNGAGKTTTIGMMTGLLEITSGNAWILNNNIANTSSMSEIRKHLGVCPQHDVLWNRLSVKEHLWLFARLKGVPSNRVKKEVDRIAKQTGLSGDGNDNKYPPQMSGGQRRKLSLGIALIGGSQIVFLDEPTSGMDPQSRRVTWDLISKEKKNRCIILTTHFMDEADILGDRIAIMGSGKIKCCGTGLYLKRLYGVGYTFTVSLNPSDNTVDNINSLKQNIDKHVFDIIKGSQEVAIAGAELTYRLPFSESKSFAKLFDILDQFRDKLCIKSYGISVTTLEEVFLKIGHDEADEPDDIDDDDNKQTEKQKQIQMNDNDKNQTKLQFAKPEISSFALREKNSFQIFCIHVYAVLYKRFWWTLRDLKGLVCSLFCPVILSAMALGLLSIEIATNEASIKLSTLNWYDNIDDVIIPATNNIGILPNDSSIKWYTIPDNVYDDNNSFFNSYDDYLQDDIGMIDLIDIDIDVNEVFNINHTNYAGDSLTNGIFSNVYPSYYNITKDFQDYLLNEAYTVNQQFYNSFFFIPYSMTSNIQKKVYFGCNGSAYHSLPTNLNIWNNWIMRYLLNSDANEASISVSNHPLPVTTRQSLISSQITGFAQAIYLVIAFSFIPSGAIYFIVNEKSTGTKHQQLVSGISFIAYWVSNYLADIFIGLPASILVFLSVYMFDSDAFEGDASAPFFITLILFLFASLPFTYLLSFIFSSPSKAQLGTILLYIVCGMVLGLVSFILDLIESTQDVNDSLKPLYRVFPVYLMAESLLNIALKPLTYPFDDYFDWEVTSRNYLLMFIEGCGYFLFVLLLEYLSTFTVLLSKLGFVTNKALTETDNDLDIDVLNEKKRILNGIISTNHGKIQINKKELNDTVVIAGLRKVYDPAGTNRLIPCCNSVSDNNKIEAVKNLYFGVKQSEVFGFLGVNGAGKTTTLATLTGERYPSSGAAFIASFPISSQLQCRRYVGYCPQFDAIFELLTASEHLKFYAMIKGLTRDEADKQVSVLLSALTLNKYKNRMAGTYSGGNKRKLSVAVSMIGNPPVIFLDEPSTGMDPVSRRHMWEFISTTMSGRCVILTTHSMEECEALCNKVGIMVNGQLECIGTPQHLKSRYGKGYQLDITLDYNYIIKDLDNDNNDDEKEILNIIDNIQNELASSFGIISLIEHNGNRLSYELIKNNDNKLNLKLGEMFNILEDLKNNKFQNIIQAYSLSQTTLEQIFIRMAKKGGKKQNKKSLIFDPAL